MKPELQVWWIPQLPMKPFEYPVPTIEAGAMLLDVLAKYDQFQFDNNIKPDYSNVGGLAWKHPAGTDDEWWDIDPKDEDDVAEFKAFELKEQP
jgi:hypothetical protein